MTIGNNTWEVVEHFAEPSQEVLLSALINGTNAISLDIKEPLSERERDELFQDIDLTMIHLYLTGTEAGIQSVLKKGMNATLPILATENSTRSSAQNTSFLLPEVTAENFEEDCLNFLHEAKENLHLDFTIFYTLSNAYLKNVIHLRTVRLLWEHMKASSLPPLKPSLKIISTSPPYPAETRTEEDMIYATTHLLASAIASADGIMLRSSEKDGHSPDFTKRITRNLHHLATYEGKLDLQHDPLAGSYYLENETNALAEKIWNNFKL